MPLLDLRCTSCGRIHPDVFVKEEKPVCDDCQGLTEIIWLRPTSVHLFREGMYENLDWEPMHFSSKRKLKQELKERGLTMPYVE